MKGKIKKNKAFIQIPILIAIIISLIVVGGTGTGVVLYKQKKLASLIANISEIFKGTEKSVITNSEKETELQKSQADEKQEVAQESNKEKKKLECPTCPEFQSCEPKEVIKEVPVEKIVYKEICSCPPAQSSPIPPIPEETYVYHDYYPIILSLSDDKGNILKSSNYNGYKGPHSYGSWQKQTLKVGDEIYLKVEASDPQGRQILYNWHSTSQYFNQLIGLEGGGFKWTTNKELRYKITPADLKSTGETLRISVQIKSDKEYLRYPSGEYDDATYVDYTLSP